MRSTEVTGMRALEVSFPGGSKVLTQVHGFDVSTDQPVHAGGEGSAPAPFDLFLASLATCAGLYAWNFLRQRNLSTEGFRMAVETETDRERGRLSRITFRLTLPRGFPDRYRKAIQRAVDLCAVKRHIVDPPRFETLLVDGDVFRNRESGTPMEMAKSS